MDSWHAYLRLIVYLGALTMASALLIIHYMPGVCP